MTDTIDDAPRIGSLFAGYGGLDLGVELATGGRPVWFSEFDQHPSMILEARFPGIPNHGDITTMDFDDVEPVDILSGGFPCQDVSFAGLRKGFTPDSRSGLWAHYARAIDALHPRLVVIENVRGLLSAQADSPMEPDPWGVGVGAGRPTLNAFGAVLGDLASLGYDARWAGVRASDIGAPHHRFRIFCIAYPTGQRRGRGPAGGPDTQESDDPWIRGHSRRGDPLIDPDRARREGGRLGAQPTAAAYAGSDDRPDRPRIDWGKYGAAVEQWERLIGRVAPSPVSRSGPRGVEKLDPAFVEWMMGLPAGWVTDVGLSRRAQLKALGNGVVPQQAAFALRLLLSRSAAPIEDNRDGLLPTPMANEGEKAAQNPSIRDGQRYLTNVVWERILAGPHHDTTAAFF